MATAKEKKPISASSIKTKAQFEKAVKDGRPIVFDSGYPTSSKSSKRKRKTN